LVENYLGEGGRPISQLQHLRAELPISVHAIGLSIGGEAPLDKEHLARIKHLCDWLEPASFSEHLAWSTHAGNFLNDLLPLPYTEKTLKQIIRHIDQVQATLGRQMLLENPSSYLQFSESTYSEPAFLNAVVAQTGCGLLLDVNNIFISCHNLNMSAEAYLNELNCAAVGEIHLAGHSTDPLEQGGDLLIDSHAAPVADPVWRLYENILRRTGPKASLIEWDTNVPEWSVLNGEVMQAACLLEQQICKYQ
jgi:uncharacterized protein (UPF0276 family)